MGKNNRGDRGESGTAEAAVKNTYCGYRGGEVENKSRVMRKSEDRGGGKNIDRRLVKWSLELIFLTLQNGI